MRKYLSTSMLILMLSFAMVPLAHGENTPDRPKQGQTQTPSQTQPQTPPQPEVKLTEAQKTELAKLHKDILEKKKEMVQKYVEFGVIPEDKGQMMIKHFEKHYEMLEQNGFVLRSMPQHHPRGTTPAPSKPRP